MKNFSLNTLKEYLQTKDDGSLYHRESHLLEFKENFQFKLMSKYLKTIAAFANNKGGVIIFGVTDSPRKLKGMSNDTFNKIDSGKITEFLNEYFSPEIHWQMKDFKIASKTFGVLIIHEAFNKPVISKKSAGKVHEGEIYYRYRGRSEKIRFPELQQIFNEREEREKKLWMEHIERIAKIGPQNISFIDLIRGEIPRKNGQNIVIDKQLLNSLKYVKEYESVEKEGAEALKIIGKIKGIETVIPDFNLEKDFYTTKELGEKLGWLSEKESAYFVAKMIGFHKLKEKPEYCQHKKNIYYYTPKCLDYFKDKNMTLKEVKKFLKENE